MHKREFSLTLLINFILLNQDSTESIGVLASLVDFSKAFNRIDHSVIITKLSDLGVPGWLLRLIASFLEGRSMVVRYKGKSSKSVYLPGGGPQGTLLGLFLFIILINDMGFEDQYNNMGEISTCKKRLRKINEIHLKYVDDLSIAEAINMSEQLRHVGVEERPQPDAFHARTGHELKPEESRVFNQLSKIQEYADENGMRMNYNKTKLMLFNPCTSKDFMPSFELNGHELEAVDKTKLLGVILTSDLKWADNTKYIVERANKKLWILRRLKKLGADQEDLLDVYAKQVRSICEFAAPVWHSSLTGEDRLSIERIQKSALHIILGHDYNSYRAALRRTGLDSLFERRRKLCKNFARKALKHPKFSKWFKPDPGYSKTRSETKKLCEVVAWHDRYEDSPLSYLTALLNQD